jgi:hypothetical protein
MTSPGWVESFAMAARVTAEIITGRSAVSVTVALTAPGVAVVSTICGDRSGG